MLFSPYIKNMNYMNRHFCSQYVNKSLSSGLFIVILLLSGCSVTPEDSNISKESEGIKSIGQRIVDLISMSEKDVNKVEDNSNEITKPLDDSRKNDYLAQEKRLMNNVPQSVITTYKQAVELMKQQQWQAALALFDEVIVKQKNLSGSYVNQALIWQRLSEQESDKTKQKTDLNKSELLLAKAIKINPVNPYAHYLKGKLLETSGAFSQAEASYRTALTIWPNFTQAQLSMAVLLELYRGRFIEANQYYSAYLLNEPEDQQVKRWQAALAIKIKRAGLSLPVHQGG